MNLSKLNGHSGKITFGGSDYQVTEWSSTISVDALPTTDSSSNGNQTVIAGTKKADFAFTMFFDATSWSAIDAGTTGTMVGHVGTTTYTVSAPVLLTSLAPKNTVGAVVTLAVNATSNGAITYV